MKNPLPWYGGKDGLADWIIGFFPPHRTYVEPFGGAASVLLKKPPSPIEVYNDVYDEVVIFFRVLRDRPQELVDKLRLTPYARAEFVNAIRVLQEGDPTQIDEVERARLFFVIARQSVTIGGDVTPGQWAYSITESRRGIAGNVSSWLSSHDRLLVVAERLKRVQIECLDALDIIARYDTEETLYYCDPPYDPGAADTSYYQHRYTVKDHEELAEALHSVRGKVIISGYHSELYDKLYGHWELREKAVHMTATVLKPGEKREPRTECLWFNFHPTGQLRLC